LLVVGVVVLEYLPTNAWLQAALEEPRRLARIAPQQAVLVVPLVLDLMVLAALVGLVQTAVLTTQHLVADRPAIVTLVEWVAVYLHFQEAVDRVFWVALEERLFQLLPTAWLARDMDAAVAGLVVLVLATAAEVAVAVLQ
jgi:hypothetical protein